MECIYAIENKLNNKKYIGVTKRFKNRIYHHFHALRKNKHHSSKLQEDYNKHGEENFIYYSILESNNHGELRLREQEFIKKYNSYTNGYNCSEGGEKLPGFKVPEVTIQALIKRNKNNKYSLGKKLTEEHKQKISIANKGTGNGMYGKKHSDEIKKILSENSKKTWSENYEKMREILSNANKNENRRKQISMQMSGEGNPRAKVSKEDVIEIRKRYSNGEIPKRILNDYPMITISGIKKICQKVSWKNI